MIRMSTLMIKMKVLVMLTRWPPQELAVLTCNGSRIESRHHDSIVRGIALRLVSQLTGSR